MNFVQYFAFFQNHPHTYLSHVTGLNLLVSYPYSVPLPIEIGYFWYDSPVDNNSGFWATDAIGGFGAWAIPFVSAIAAVLFWVVDSCAKPFDPKFVALMLSFAALSFANLSLGTTFVSGGVGLVCVALCFLPTRGAIARRYIR
jgi:hypothetical protein